MINQTTIDEIKNELGEALKKSEQTTQTEDALSSLLLVLEQADIINEESKKLMEERLFEDFFFALMHELLSSFSEDEEKSLINAKQSGLNDIQMLHLQLELYKKNKGREIEEYAEELYHEMAERVLKELEIIRESVNDVEKLSDEQVLKLNQLIQEEKEEEALKMLNSFKGEGPEDIRQDTQPLNTPTNRYDHIITLVKEDKLDEAREEINKVMLNKQQDTTSKDDSF